MGRVDLYPAGTIRYFCQKAVIPNPTDTGVNRRGLPQRAETFCTSNAIINCLNILGKCPLDNFYRSFWRIAEHRKKE